MNTEPNTALIGVLGDYDAFLKRFFSELASSEFDLGDFVQADHICYRTVSDENYRSKKNELDAIGSLLSEVNISGRPIATYRLKNPIIFEGWRIDCIELPAPKAGAQYTEGLEHVEMVIYDDFDTFTSKYPNKTFDMRAADRGINPEVGYKLSTCGVKFHLVSLAAAIYLETKLGITEIH